MEEKIRAAVFDFGNVISGRQAEDTFKKMEGRFGIPEKVLAQAMTIRAPFDSGEIDRIELYRRVLEQNGFEEKSRDRDFCRALGDADMESWFSVNEETCAFIRSLKASGYKTGILSNMPFDFLELYGKNYQIFGEVDYALFSCHVNIIKPDRKIYELLLKNLGVRAEETVFFDDIQKNIDAAKECGIRGILFKDTEQARRDFYSLAKTIE